jgi:hypothetical protein
MGHDEYARPGRKLDGTSTTIAGLRPSPISGYLLYVQHGPNWCPRNSTLFSYLTRSSSNSIK